MKAFFIFSIILAAHFTMPAISWGIQVTWAPFTPSFEVVSFSFPIEMKEFPVETQGNDYTIFPVFDGIELNGKISIDVYSTSNVVGRPKKERESSTIHYESEADVPYAFDVTFPPFPPGSDVVTQQRIVILYLHVKSMINPSVAISFKSKKGGSKSDTTFHKPSYTYPSVGNMTFESLHNNTKEPTNDFVFTISDFTPNSASTPAFEIRSAFRSHTPFSLRPGYQNANICTINGKSVRYRIEYDAIHLPTRIGDYENQKTLVIKCPAVNYTPHCEEAFVATWIITERSKYSALTQALIESTCPLGYVTKNNTKPNGFGTDTMIVGIITGVAVIIGAIVTTFYHHRPPPQQVKNVSDLRNYGTISDVEAA